MSRLDRIDAHFDRLCGLEEQAQRLEVDKLNLPDADRILLLELLAADRRDGDPIQSAIRIGAEGVVAPDTARFGPWHLLHELGSGGMGTVFLAERSDGHFEQKVAIKLLRGFPTTENMRRMRQERRILAGLNHPNIARLLDGGETDAGQPWLAIEYVDGLPLLGYVRLHAPALLDRLALFEAMLDAIEHAHQHLIVHRDLKPANVLVTNSGTVKLLDFGIARLIDASDDSSSATSTQIYSRGYASPEQREGRSITTASDIYSLGVILRELLTGVRNESEGTAPTVSPLPLNADLAGIIAKARAANPQDRYAGVGELRRDISRFREGRPVSATPLTRFYRLRKFVGRHRIEVAASVLALLLAGVSVWHLELQRSRAVQAESAAQQARAMSERDAASAHASLQFLTDALSAASPDVSLSKQVGVRDLLDSARRKLDATVGSEPAFSRQMKRLLAMLYAELGEPGIARDLMREGLAGVAPSGADEALRMAADYDAYAGILSSLEDTPAAMTAARTAMAWRRKFAPDNLLLQIQTLQTQAVIHHRSGNDKEAIQVLRQSIELAEVHGIKDTATRLESTQLLANLLAAQGECEESLKVANQGLSLADTLPADSPSRLTIMRAEAAALNSCGRTSEAEHALRKTIALQDKVVANGGLRMAGLTNDLALTLNDLGRYQEAATLLQQSDSFAHELGLGMVEQAISLANHAGILESAGDYTTSLTLFDKAAALLEQGHVEADHQSRRRMERAWARTLGLSGQTDRAWSMLQELRERSRRLDGTESGEYAMLTWQLAQLAQRMGKQDAGFALMGEAEQLWRALVPATHPIFAHVLRLRSRWAISDGNYPAAEQNLRSAIPILGNISGSSVDLAIAQSELAGVLIARGQRRDAARLLQEAMPTLRSALFPEEIHRAHAEGLARRLNVKA